MGGQETKSMKKRCSTRGKRRHWSPQAWTDIGKFLEHVMSN